MPEITEGIYSSRDSSLHPAAFVDIFTESEISTPTVARHDIAEEKYQILGMKVFTYDSEFLSSRLADVLAWWRGERKPKGVPVELARRCT